MVHVQQSPQDGWLKSDNTVFVSALAAITVATSSVLLWCCQRSILQDTAHSPVTSTLSATITSLRFSAFPSPLSDNIRVETIPEEVPRDVAQQQGEQSTQGKTLRSKERRRRGKDPFKEFSKSGKKYKELLRQLDRPSTVPNGISITPISERDFPQHEKFTLETDESPSVQTPGSFRFDGFASNQHSTTHGSPAQLPSKSLDDKTANPLSADKSDPEAEATEEPEYQRLSSKPTKMVLSDMSSVFGEPNASSLDSSSRASPGHLAPSLESSTLRKTSCSTSSTSSRQSRLRLHSRVTSSWDWDRQSSFYHDPPPRFTGASVVNSRHESRSPIHSPVTSTPPDTPSSLPGILSSPSIDSSTLCSATSLAPTSLANARTPHIPYLPITPPLVSVSAQTEIASLRGALKAARLREEKSRAEAERRAKDYDALSWRWTEERTRWHRREAELYAQIQHLTHALQMYAGSRPFSSATVPIFPAFVSSPLPCAVPSTMTHPLCTPTLDSTRRRCRKRVQDDEEGNVNSDSDVFPFNDKVAGAILKRPESLREGKRRSSTPPNEVGPLRFPSLSNLGNVWPVRKGEAETPSRAFRSGASMGLCKDGKETEGVVRMVNDTTSSVVTDSTRDQTQYDEEQG